MMTAEQFVRRKAGIAGGIRALVDSQGPCATGCTAHAGIVAVHKLQADNIEADAEFFGNGFGDAVADRVADRLKATPVVQTERAVPVPTPWGMKHLSEALLWRIAIIVTILLASRFMGKPVSEADLSKAVQAAFGLSAPAATNEAARTK
jgi:hypothetical protein